MLAHPSISGACLFLHDNEDDFLIVKPHGKGKWLIPDAFIAANESPKEALRREIKQELGIEVNIGRLLLMDYLKDEDSFRFLFDCGELDSDDVRKIHLNVHELTEYEFCSLKKSKELLSSELYERMNLAFQAFKENKTYYLEDGQLA